ncbi:MAG: hypothetical protein HKL86_06310 [Acidimicrobiaceae bacterium]|nr:hypothetical protein [Acidimicrobiaceae bacterium]
MARVPKPQGRAKGGVARAKNLSAAERRVIAMSGAQARWNAGDLPQAVCSSEDHPLRIAGVELDAYVLDDGTRILSQAALLRALGRNPRAATRSATVPPMLQATSLAPFVTPELLEAATPIHFRTPTGTRANGYRAELLPQICEVYLKARDARALAPNQKGIATQADILMRAFATVGIIALVDEATGFQDLRSKRALAEILEQFIDKELQAWVKTFPDDYYRQLFRLRDLSFPDGVVKRPQYFGHLTNDVIYKRLAPGVLDELKRVTARDDEGRTSHRYFQRLTSNHGYPKLREHLGSVVTIMKLSDSWDDFIEKLDRLHPRYGETPQLALEYADEIDTGKGF